ncbi:transcriptional regulator [Viridibacillus arvi]|uniref:transcriptional regulator n=1 Tax=Viridibacillus arvi TaxID=263475 RepID=UPI003D2691DE
MLKLLNLDKQVRKSYVKSIEKHLKNYKYYLKAIVNIEKQFTKFPSNEFSNNSLPQELSNNESMQSIKNELNLLKFITENIDDALEELNDVELQYIECRYFKKWSINKSALEMGYSDKALFTIRNQLMEKLLILLGSIVLFE